MLRTQDSLWGMRPKSAIWRRPFPRVQLTFDTVEGLDALITALQRTRAQMTGVLK